MSAIDKFPHQAEDKYFDWGSVCVHLHAGLLHAGLHSRQSWARSFTTM